MQIHALYSAPLDITVEDAVPGMQPRPVSQLRLSHISLPAVPSTRDELYVRTRSTSGPERLQPLVKTSGIQGFAPIHIAHELVQFFWT